MIMHTSVVTLAGAPCVSVKLGYGVRQCYPTDQARTGWAGAEVC